MTKEMTMVEKKKAKKTTRPCRVGLGEIVKPIFRRAISPQPKGYLNFYLLPVIFGVGLYTIPGGVGMGHLYGNKLVLLGAKNLAENGGYAWGMNYAQHETWECPFDKPGRKISVEIFRGRWMWAIYAA